MKNSIFYNLIESFTTPFDVYLLMISDDKLSENIDAKHLKRRNLIQSLNTSPVDFLSTIHLSKLVCMQCNLVFIVSTAF